MRRSLEPPSRGWAGYVGTRARDVGPRDVQVIAYHSKALADPAKQTGVRVHDGLDLHGNAHADIGPEYALDR